VRLIDVAKGSIHDVAICRALSDLSDNVLLVSDRSLLILQQLAAREAGWYSRWQSELINGHFAPVQPGTQNATFIDSVVEQLGLELMPINPDLVDALNAIAAAIAGLTPSGGGSTTVNCGSNGCQDLITANPLAPCLAPLAPGDYVDGEPSNEVTPGTPPSGFNTWSEYTAYKCQAAHTLVDAIETLCRHLQYATNVAKVLEAFGAAVGIVALLTGAIFPPAAIAEGAAALASAILISATACTIFGQIATYFQTNHDQLVCALYRAGTAVVAIDAIANVIEDAIQTVEWGALLPFSTALAPLIKTVLASVQTNNFVRPLFQAGTSIVASTRPCTCIAGCGQWLKWGTFANGVYTPTLQGQTYYLEIYFNATAEGVYCGTPVTIIDVPVQTGSISGNDNDVWRFWHQSGGNPFLNGRDEPEWPVTSVGDMTIASLTAFTCRVEWY